MKYTYARFTGYAGFFHGLGLRKFEVDFTRCISNIVLIVGKNASGKTTLMNSLNLFPDPSLNFLPDMDAEKILSLFDNGNIYNIQISSPIDGKGGRKTTKAFIQKNSIELNPNGNVSSYKDIIFSEFDLDSSFLALSKLSSNDRGLGDKTPAERKKFVSNIIENLDVYNDIYKTLNKKSLIFKSHINTLYTKIQNIGNPESVRATLIQFKNREKKLNDDILDLNNKIVTIKANTSINEDEAVKIKENSDRRNELLEFITKVNGELDGLCNKIKVNPDEAETILKENEDLSNYYEEKAKTAEIIWTEKSSRINTMLNEINELKAQITKYENNVDGSINELLDKSNKNIKEFKSELKKYNIDYSNSDALLSKIPVVRIEFDNFVKAIDAIYAYSSPKMLDYICNKDLNLELQNEKKKHLKYDTKISESKDIMNEMIIQMKALATLEHRPKKCNNDSCPFISDALKIYKIVKDRDLSKEFEDLEKEIQKYGAILYDTEVSMENISNYISERSKLDIIVDRVMSIADYDNLVPAYLKDKNTLLKMISDNNYFNDLRNADRLNEIESLLINLNSEEENNRYLQVEFKRYTDNVNILNSSNSKLETMEKNYKDLVEECSQFNHTFNDYKNLYTELQPKIDTLKLIVSNLSIKSGYESELESIDKILKSYKDKSDLASSMILNIKDYENRINLMKQELEPLQNDISRINGQLVLLDSYYQEYNQYNEKYNMIETIKKYCSPTGGGIQTVFMQLYMSKTLELSNQLLGMLFQGEYRLLDFIINENEFRIPFIDSSGIPIEDVAFGSNAQVSMIGLVINLVLLYQASSHYNIARLDEIGSSCDGYNRSVYIQVLNAIINILHMDQLFVISHDIDLDNTVCDIIKLKGYEGFDSNSLQGNVIYDYNSEVKE